jgi:hypothetical protein
MRKAIDYTGLKNYKIEIGKLQRIKLKEKTYRTTKQEGFYNIK